MPFHLILFYSIRFYSIICYSDVFDFIMLYYDGGQGGIVIANVLYSILFYSILFYSILL